MTVVAAITETDIAAWTGVALAALAALGTIATAAIALIAKIAAQANEVRLDRHGTKLAGIESDMTKVALATTPPAATNPPIPAPAKFVIDYDKLAASLAEKMKAKSE